MINRKLFYDKIRQEPFNGSLDQRQVDGISAILDEWEKRQLTDLRWLAYMLATTCHETGATMWPVEESLGSRKGRKYNEPDPVTGKTYYGRGFVQLTWPWNYKRMSIPTGEDLYHFPEKALKLNAAAIIMFDGMIHGLFTGKKLSDYFLVEREEPENARRIINGMDRAHLIAGYYRQFLQALKPIL